MAPAGSVPRVSPVRCPMALEPKYIQVPWSLFGLRTSFGGTSTPKHSELLQPTSSAAAPQPDSRAAGGHRREVLTAPAPSLQQPQRGRGKLSCNNATRAKPARLESGLSFHQSWLSVSKRVLRILQGGLCRLRKRSTVTGPPANSQPRRELYLLIGDSERVRIGVRRPAAARAAARCSLSRTAVWYCAPCSS